MIVLDTSALLFFTLDPVKLSPVALRVIEQADRCLVSSISIWEIALKVKRGRLVLPLSTQNYVELLSRLASFEILPLDVQTWLDNLELDWDHRDPADRTVVALATRYACPLITSDRLIAEFYPQTIW